MALERRRGRQTLSEINVTPLVDVMLVLLIIFMVTAPLIQQGVEVDLPGGHRPRRWRPPRRKLVLTVGQGPEVYLGSDEVPDEPLEATLLANERMQKEKEALRAGR